MFVSELQPDFEHSAYIEVKCRDQRVDGADLYDELFLVDIALNCAKFLLNDSLAVDTQHNI